MRCHICNNELNENDKFCNSCGAKVEEDNNEERCLNCDAVLNPNDKFCSNCGSATLRTEEKKEFCHICNSEVSTNDKFCLSCGARLKRDFGEEEDIIASRFQNNPVTNIPDDKMVFWISLGAVGFSLILSGVFPVISLIIAVGALGYAIFNFIKHKNKFNGWAVGLGVLALLIGGIGLTNDLITKDYANKSAERISEIVNVDIPNVEPAFYSILIMDGQFTGVSFRDYVNNDIVYKLGEADALEFINGMDVRFKQENIDLLEEYFSEVMLPGSDISLIYDLENKTFALPDNMDEYNLIIINFDYEENTLQILEISTLEG